MEPVVEVYKTYDALEAGRIRDLLADHDIACSVRDLTISPYPLTIGQFGEQRVGVSRDDAPAARQVLQDAIRDGYLSATGSWITEPGPSS
jgi:hypothetical protein